MLTGNKMKICREKLLKNLKNVTFRVDFFVAKLSDSSMRFAMSTKTVGLKIQQLI